MDMIRILIVDDHPVVREGLRGMLEGQPDFTVVGAGRNGAEGVEQAALHTPDVVLMDLQMPEMDGVSAIEAIKQRNIQTHVLVLTTYDSDTDIVRAIEAGATGYLLKDTPRDELFLAIRAAARGQSVLAPTVATRLMTRMRQPAREQLSDREVEVLNAVKEGMTNREIGRKLHISTATVKTHLIHIFAKLDVSDRTSAVTVALERGIIAL
jgi:DNA-binding NarL/FixJ family response regulator